MAGINKKCCKMGTHECEVLMITFGIKDSNKIVSIDRCLASEICALWNLGIETLGCCCGHGEQEPSIVVDKKYRKRMESLGYGIPMKQDKKDGTLWYHAITPFAKTTEKSQEKHAI